MIDGWIKLHRKFLEWEWYTDLPTKCLALHFILRANHVPKRWNGITIDRGQFITSRGELSRETGLSIQQIRTAKTRLEGVNFSTSKTTSHYTLITICNYDSYQCIDSMDQPTEQPAINQPSTTNKNEKNNKKKDNKKKAIAFAPPTLSEIENYFTEKGYSVEVAKKMFDYYDTAMWRDSTGKPVRNWKQKCISVWFKDENKKTKNDESKPYF